MEVKNLREKLDSAVALTTNGSAEKKPGRSLSKRKLGIQGFWETPALHDLGFQKLLQAKPESSVYEK
ncbi:hypothetical protein glysoja_028463 [Glycine soja]|uniref:Uncharacterized protein n=1 Tax=Glycine soja TaxID=3848 RepID=A0A0B2NXF0_GLYSO|nr:hypothetical protein glysoja_028463 [Glycine soja]